MEEQAAPEPSAPNGVPKESSAPSEAPVLTYADIIPGYSEMNANQKKKIRKKNKLTLRDAQDKATAEWEALQRKT